MPIGMLTAMLEEIPALEARERLDAISDHAVGAGAAKRHEATRHIRALERMIGGRKSASAGELEAMGIKVEHG